MIADAPNKTIPNELKRHFKTTSECPLCSGKTHTHLFEVNHLHFFECRSCRFRFMNPFLSDEGMKILYENSDVLAQINPALEQYYEYAIEGSANRTLLDYRMVLKFLEKSKVSNAGKPKLFEVGYGNGGFLLEAVRCGWEIDGIDTSKQNHERLQKNFGVCTACGIFDDFEPLQRQYQAVVFWDVIEHTMNPHGFVKKAWNMLAPGGFIVLATPNISGLLNLVSEWLCFVSAGKIKTGVKQLYVFEHVGYYTPETLGRLVSMEGFEIKKIALTETDLNRYHFSPLVRFFLNILFFIARFIHRQNRVILIAQKSVHES